MNVYGTELQNVALDIKQGGELSLSARFLNILGPGFHLHHYHTKIKNIKSYIEIIT